MNCSRDPAIHSEAPISQVLYFLFELSKKAKYLDWCTDLFIKINQTKQTLHDSKNKTNISKLFVGICAVNYAYYIVLIYLMLKQF